jgi:hypothetical protein
MNLSANQIVATTLKAARGAGFPMAQAECFAAATAQHLIQNRSEDDLSQALIHTDDSPILSLPALLDEVCVSGSQTLQNPNLPSLVQSYVETAAFEAQCIRAGQTILIKHLSDRTPVARVEMSPTLWAHLNKLAAKTYVPASEASRISGAGAGLSDND